MPGPTPITANYRLKLLYTCNLFQHKLQAYCTATPSADPSGYDLVGRSGGPGNTGLQAAVDRFFTKIAPFYTPGETTFDGWILEQRSGTAFGYLANGATTVVPTAGGSSYQIANGECLSGKSFTSENMPVFIYEGGFGAANKYSSYAPLAATTKGFIDYFFNVGGSPNVADAWNWRESRSRQLTTRWIAMVVDTNEKLRRIRRIK